MSRWGIWFSSAIITLLLFAACGGDNGGSQEQITVVASTSIIGALAEAVAGEQADVVVLMDRGTDPHTYETTPGDVRTIEGADIMLINGLGLDDHLIDDVEAANADVEIVTVSDGIDVLSSDDDTDHGGVDPHIWQDPLRVKIMIDNIATALASVDPEHTGEYTANADAYNQILDETHQEILAMVDTVPPEQRKLVTNHDAFSYFADRYGFEIVGAVIPSSSTESEPSARDIANLHDLIEREGVHVIFAEELIDPKIAEQIAADTGIAIVYGLYTGQIGEPGSGADTVHGMLLTNARIITEALRNN